MPDTTIPRTHIDLDQMNADNDTNNDYHVKWSLVDKIMNNKNANTTANTNSINFSQGTEQTITNITDLQTMEMQLYTSLDNISLTQAERSSIINRINQLAQTRMTLYQGISNMASVYQENITTSNNTIQEQLLAIDIVENELNVAKRRLNLLEENKYNKLRLVEINTYYGKQYNAYKDIAKNIVYICILVLSIVILGKNGILPTNVYIALNVLIITIGAVIVGSQIVNVSNRDNMNFDEYNWYFDKSKAPTDTTDSTTGALDPWAMPGVTCVGSMCCDQTNGFVYDSVQNICILSGKTNTNTCK